MGPAWTMRAQLWGRGWDAGTEMQGPMSQGDKRQKLGKQLPEERQRVESGDITTPCRSLGWNVNSLGE